jgi:hypothetical protein
MMTLIKVRGVTGTGSTAIERLNEHIWDMLEKFHYEQIPKDIQFGVNDVFEGDPLQLRSHEAANLRTTTNSPLASTSFLSRSNVS